MKFQQGQVVGPAPSLRPVSYTHLDVYKRQLDTCVGRIVNAMQSIDGEVIITADHGNAETMFDVENNQPHTQHTTNKVPFIYIGREAILTEGGALSDLAPTLLHMMGVPQPIEMTGKNLVAFK